MAKLDEKIEGIYNDVLKRNPGEIEFHQAVLEVLESLGPVVVKHPEYLERKIIERICEPERQIIFRVPGRMIRARCISTVVSGLSLTALWDLTRAACVFTPPSTSVSSSSSVLNRSLKTH